jgi:hypothetical protein
MNLSLQIQEQFCTTLRAQKLINGTIRVSGTLKKKSEEEKEALTVSDSVTHRTIALRNNTRTIIINRLKFIRSIIHNLQSSLFDVVASHRESKDGNENVTYNYILTAQ